MTDDIARALKAFENFGEDRKFQPPGLFDVARIERAFDSLLTDCEYQSELERGCTNGSRYAACRADV